MNNAFALIKERIGLTEVTAALGHMDTINLALKSRDYARAIGTIRLLRPKLIELRQLPSDKQGRQEITKHLATLSALSEELEHAAYEDREVRALPFPRELERINDMLHHYASQMRYKERHDPSEAA